MKNILKKSILIVLCLTMVLSLCACGSSGVLVDQPLFDEDHKTNPSDSFVITNDSSAYELHWDSENCRIYIQNKESGKIYACVPTEYLEPRIDESTGFPITNHPKTESPIMIEYVDVETDYASKSANGYVRSLKNGAYSLEKTADGNGFKITYYFDSIDVSIPIVYTLLDDGIKMTIVPEEITETDSFMLSKISIAPFFCSVKNVDENAYLFYPSGTGTIIEANNNSDISTSISADVYGTDALRRETTDILANTSESIRMPVFGAKNGDHGVLAIITDGAESATIDGDIGNINIGYSALYTTFLVRGTTTMDIDKVATGLQYSEQIVHTPLSVSYYPLEGDQANYIGMANRYRKYLIDEKGMKDKEEVASTSISLVGGSTLETSFLGVPTTKVFATTTVNEANKILTELDSKLNLPIVADLIGYGKSGIDVGKPAGNLEIAKNIGTEADVKVLAAKCKELGIDLYFDYDLLHFSSNGLGLTLTRGGSAKGPGHIYNRWYSYRLGDSHELEPMYLVARSELAGLANKTADHVKSMDVPGIAFRKITANAYSDYADNKTITKANMGNDVAAILNTMSESGLKVLANQANDYAAINADAVIDVPLSSSLRTVFDYDVPFYQIVFKGYVTMYGAAVNMTTNRDLTVLRCIEGGSPLKYTLIHTFENDLLTSKTQMFNSLLYSDNVEDLTKRINETSEYFKAIEDAHIIDHVTINKNVRKVVYDNGITVFVNYGTEAFETELGSVAAGSYIYGKGGN